MPTFEFNFYYDKYEEMQYIVGDKVLNVFRKQLATWNKSRTIDNDLVFCLLKTNRRKTGPRIQRSTYDILYYTCV